MTVTLTTKLAILLALTWPFRCWVCPNHYRTGDKCHADSQHHGSLVRHDRDVDTGHRLPAGYLAPPLGPAIPFIVLGNWAYIFTFAGLRKVNQYLALVVAAVLKLLVLAGAVRFLLSVPPPVAKALQFPQLITALVGGLAALIVWPGLQKTGID